MSVEALGMVTAGTNSATASGVNIEDFLQIFLAQLNFQDPLKPVDNREFLAQLAQFSSLEIANRSNENLESLLDLSSIDQTVAVLGKEVEAESQSGSLIGKVVAVRLDPNGSPEFTIKTSDDQNIVGIRPSQIRLVR